MDLSIEQRCPQCGAPVSLPETDLLLTCDYCGVKSFLLAGTGRRYVLPAKAHNSPAGEDLLYAPYLRFRGTIFMVTEQGIVHRVVDTTQKGCSLDCLPPSLGLRPQAMHLSRIEPRLQGLFLPLTVKASIILKRAAQVSDMVSGANGLMYHRAYIGETLSFIYLPLLQKGKTVIDAVVGRPLTDNEATGLLARQGKPYSPNWRQRVLGTVCPGCGGLLDGEGDCLVLTCTNCDRAWEFTGRELTEVVWSAVRSKVNAERWLPFWKVAVDLPTLGIASFADFIGRTNQPFVIKPQWREERMSFWIPAFKLQPRIFLKTATRVSVKQFMMEEEPGRPRPGLMPVTLPRTEARQAVKVTLASAAVNRKSLCPLLPQVKLKEVDINLVYLPFLESGYDIIQEQTRAVISKSAVRGGRRL